MPINPGALVTGHQAGRQVVAQQEAERRKSELQTMQMTTQNLQNQENQMIMDKVNSMEQKYKDDYSASMKSKGDEVATKYYQSLKPDAMVSNEFSADIGALQTYIKGIPSLAKMGNVRVPNVNDPEEMAKVSQILNIGVTDEDGYTTEEITNETNMRALSGEVIINANGDPVKVQDVFATIGATPEISANKKYEAYMTAVNDMHLAKKGEYGKQAVDLYSSYRKIEDDIAEMQERGDVVPEELYDQFIKAKTTYLKKYGGETAPRDFLHQQEEIRRARTSPAYEGEATDLLHYNKVQVKDKDKRFGEVQEKVEGARTFIATDNRMREILSEAGSAFTRDAVSTALAKVGQHFEGGLIGLKAALTSKDPAELAQAQAAFDRIETAVGYPMVQLIKEISGAAVSDKEREYLMNLVVGGEFKNLNALTEKLDEFKNLKIKEAKKYLDKKVTGGHALRPKWAEMVEAELEGKQSSGKVGSTLPKKETPIEEPKKATMVDKVKGMYDKVKSRISGKTMASAKDKAEAMQVEVDDAPINDKQAEAISKYPDGQEVRIKGVVYTVKGGRLWK